VRGSGAYLSTPESSSPDAEVIDATFTGQSGLHRRARQWPQNTTHEDDATPEPANRRVDSHLNDTALAMHNK
jgi:hypothetical protein